MQQKLKEISLHLLDLGKKNRLINYKPIGYRNIEVYNPNIEDVFHKLTNGSSLSIFQLDPVLKKYNKTIEGTQEEIEEYSLGKVKDIALPLLKANDLLCYKKGISLQKVCKALYKEHKNTLLEKGINCLYMTFGMVEYYEKKESFLAPLLLVPIDLRLENFCYKIKAQEDEVILNPTLVYLLKNEYKLELEEFEAEKTFQEYFHKTSVVLEEKQMKLHLFMTIGVYSFLKMNMFNDLMYHMDTVLENDNIQMLLGGAYKQKKLYDLPIFPVVDADSSQLEAIIESVKGNSFVLQGPPGTGKSQTITNMIASLIGNGKKVLFVSEKQAALSVVYENLKRVGLESFAIELHSHKANRKDFIEELYKTSILPKYDIQQDVQDLDRKYMYLSDELQEYRQKLHQKIERVQKSVYEMYSLYLKAEPTDFVYPIPFIEKLKLKDLEDIKQQLLRYQLVSSHLGYDYHQGPFYGMVCQDLSYIRYEAKKDLEDLYDFFSELIIIKKKIISTLPFTIENYKQIVETMPWLDRLIQLNSFLPQYFIPEQRELLCKRIKRFQTIEIMLEKTSLKQFLDLRIIHLEGLEAMTEEFEKYSKKAWKMLSIKYQRLKKEFKPYMRLRLKDKDLVAKLKEAIIYKKNSILYSKIKRVLPPNSRSFELEIYYGDAYQLKDFPYSLELTEDTYAILKQKLLDIVIHFRKVNRNLNSYLDKFDFSILNFIEGNLEGIVEKLKKMKESIGDLDYHAQRLEILQDLNQKQMLSFLDKALLEKVPLKKLAVTFESVFWQANLVYELEHSTILKEFSRQETEQILKDYQDLDRVHFEMNKAHIVSKLSNQRPDETIITGTKFAILVKEYNKLRKQKPIRVLLEEIFDLILQIKPVFLMSPLSVSTYLNSELNLFDTVIFDEASQVFAWDALGAIYRAKQCIIIGDSKQMPPSNFFSSLLDEEEDYENELESILDKGSSVFSSKRLNWHYRSKNEELIAFSNKEFYDNRLITIPSAMNHKRGFGVDFHYVMGTYEVKARTNQQEAFYIVNLIFEHIKNRPMSSLGVIAFSNAQAELIQDELEQELLHHPEYASFFNEEKREPFFIKNLESVQGDERDVIFFSICFGYTKEHKFYQRFGPLNMLGGERRLNVAVTRAKENICIVSSIHSSDIRLDQTESRGVALLKKYLEYAEASTEIKHRTMDIEDGVIDSVVKCIMKAGYHVQTKLGSSMFLIDIIVMNPKTKEYDIAILLDGPSYQIGNVRDANVLQEKLLKRLGWQFLRIFTLKWVEQNELEKRRLLDFITHCIHGEETKENLESSKSFLVEIEDTFEEGFEPYPLVSMDQITKIYNQKGPVEVISYVISKEEPIHVDYLLKRICFMYGRTKVTSLVREGFENDIKELFLFRDGDFLSTHPIGPTSLRISSDRTIEHIHIEELKDAIYKIVIKSNGITKDGCFKAVIGLLGYNRMSDKAIEILDSALVFLKLDGKIIEKENCLFY